MNDPAYIAHLIGVYRNVHECDAKHVETVPVKETWKDHTVWEGDVEVFDLIGHPKASRGYAWNYDKEKGGATICVLELPPVISPKTAVQAAIAAQGK